MTTSRLPNRRSVLTGAAALARAALGAGGAGLAGALGDSAPPAQVHAASPGEELMVEHGVLKRLLLSYRAVVERVDAGRVVPTGAVVDAAQLISDYVEGFHEGLEEAYVFPRVAPQEPALVRTLLVQHDRGRHLTAAITDLTTDGLRTARSRSALRAHLTSFVRMYEPHEAWEDTVVYPTLRRVTPQRTLDDLAGRFADLQDAQYGDQALGVMLQRVAGIEDELGIGDLGRFTPPPL